MNSSPFPPPELGRPASQSAPEVSVRRALSFAVGAPNRNHNLAAGSLLLLVPMVGPIALMGFLCEIQQRLAREQARPVPRLDMRDIGHYMGRGLAPLLVELALGLPVVLLAYGLLALAIVIAAWSGETIEPWMSVLGLALMGIGVLAALTVLTILVNAGRTRAELTEDFAEALSLGPLLAYARATGPTVLAKNTALYGIGLAMSLGGLLLFCVGVFPVSVLLQIAGVHLRWQIYASFMGSGGSPVELKPPAELPSEGPSLGDLYGGY